MKVAHITEKLVTGTAPPLRSEKISAQLMVNRVRNAIMAIITHRCVKSDLEQQMLQQRNDPQNQVQIVKIRLLVKMKLANSGLSTHSQLRAGVPRPLHPPRPLCPHPPPHTQTTMMRTRMRTATDPLTARSSAGSP